jgi:entericidin B
MTRLIAVVALFGAFFLTGCNTIAGAGQDLSKGGQAISNEAEKAK